MSSKKKLSRKTLPPLVKVSFAARLARPWLSGIGESMWVFKLTGTKMRGAGLLANQPYQLPYARLGDLVLYATDQSHEKPEALAVEQPKLEHDFKAMFNGDQKAWIAAASCSRGKVGREHHSGNRRRQSRPDSKQGAGCHDCVRARCAPRCDMEAVAGS